MTELGFKKLTLDNWLEPEKLPSAWVRISDEDGQARHMTCKDWLRAILEPQLIEEVPKDIHALFEVARGAIAYGCFFYPLYTLGNEQLFRVFEAAVNYKCREMGAPKSTKNYYDKLRFLAGKGILSEEGKERWRAARKLRNIASHPDGQSIIMPNQAIGTLMRIADEINFLCDNHNQLKEKSDV